MTESDSGTPTTVQIGRLDGFITARDGEPQRLTVVLDTGRDIETLRDEVIAKPLGLRDAALLAEQCVQEAIGNELAWDGWVVIGEGDTAHEVHRMLDVVASSRTWVVQRIVPK
ncbi:MAG TPA: hypothetical protein VNZ58_06980 [Thermomicrobiales bacterium]|nr:hypothetical protein [Thermomicrobiales bacterium]